MSDAIAIAQEQVAWWLDQGYTPREALKAISFRVNNPCAGNRGTRLTWGNVLDRTIALWLTISAAQEMRGAA